MELYCLFLPIYLETQVVVAIKRVLVPQNVKRMLEVVVKVYILTVNFMGGLTKITMFHMLFHPRKWYM